MVENDNDPDAHHDCAWYEDRETEDRELDLERKLRKQFVEPVYRDHANSEELFRFCEARCRRSGRCRYLRDEQNHKDGIQPIGYNLRVRFMPLCIARTANARLMEWLRYSAEQYFK